ncbi:MAG: hypothetical protein KatS3mg027_2000 [Bacteroidia bacterium]|nr:MAG: hypothetical protein KatS3mg027_2000 [Bacteroidia bacterium]
MKRILVFYDISEDRVRNEMVKVLKRCGFYRIQKSVFMGCTNEEGMNRIEGFVKYMRSKEECRMDSVIVMHLDDRILQSMRDLMRDEEEVFSNWLKMVMGKKVVVVI